MMYAHATAIYNVLQDFAQTIPACLHVLTLLNLETTLLVVTATPAQNVVKRIAQTIHAVHLYQTVTTPKTHLLF